MVRTYRGPVDASALGQTLIHEHIFVRNFELELNLPDPEWDAVDGVERAVACFTDLATLGIGTVVDLTVPGLGRDVHLVAQVAERVAVHIVAATGWYTPNALPIYFAYHGPGRLVDPVERLTELFVRDIREGIAGTAVRAGIVKVMTDAEGFTPDVTRVLEAAAQAHAETGVPIATHSRPADRNGLEQQARLGKLGVAPERIIVGHCGDTDDIGYLRELMDNGSSIGMDRFGMEHVLADDTRIRAVLNLLDAGYADRMVISHDAAVYSHVTPPSWRARHAPRWRMDTIPRSIVPALRSEGASAADIHQLLVENPRRLLEVRE